MWNFSASEFEIGVIPKDSDVAIRVERIRGVGNDVEEFVAAANSAISSRSHRSKWPLYDLPVRFLWPTWD